MTSRLTGGNDVALDEASRSVSPSVSGILFGMTRHVFIALLLLAGCAQSPERTAVRNANSLMKQGQLPQALEVAESYLAQHPDSVVLLRLRVFIFLKAERLDMAAPAVKQLPAGDPVLSKALRHSDSLIRSSAAKLIAERPADIHFKTLVRALDDSVPTVRRYAARALGELRNPRALKPLFRSLNDDNWFVRAEAATALGKIGEPRAAGWLLYLLNDGDGFVRYSAMHALQRLASESNRDLLVRALDRANQAEQRFGIAFALAKLREPAALAPLVAGTTNANAEIRRHAAEALGISAVPAATNALARLLGDPEAAVRVEATLALRKLQGGPVREPVER